MNATKLDYILPITSILLCMHHISRKWGGGGGGGECFSNISVQSVHIQRTFQMCVKGYI